MTTPNTWIHKIKYKGRTTKQTKQTTHCKINKT